jgi:hypothetical protein
LKWFWFFLKKISVWLFFFCYKNQTEQKMITHNKKKHGAIGAFLYIYIFVEMPFGGF